MKRLCVITIKLNTLTDAPYKMTVGGAYVSYVKTCERGCSVYNAVRIIESQCIK